MRTRLLELEHQQSNQDRVNTALQDMLEDKRRLAYEKGVLQAENEKLRRTLTTAEKKFHEVQSLAWDKEKEAKFLMRNKDEALKETERLIKQTDIYDKKYSKKIDSLQRSLVQSKEDNKKLASTLETVITSHTQLQASFERLQTELGKRDSEAIFTNEERSTSQSKISELTREVETLQEKLIAMQEIESQELGPLHKALKILEEDRDKLMNTVETLMTANKDLQESLDKLAKEIYRKETEIKKLRQTSQHERNEMKMENMAKENKVDETQKQFEKEIKEMRIKHKKEITKLRKEFQDMMTMKNALKQENNSLKREQKEEEIRHKKLKEKFKVTKNQLEQCLRLQTTQEKEVETARQRIEAMSHELATLEHLKTEYTRNNVEQARSLQEFVSQLTDLQEEFRNLSDVQQETSLLCRQKDEEITKEKLRRKEIEVLCYKLKNREKELHEKRNDTERKLEEANVESQQVAANLQEAHEWFKDKFTNLQSELSKSKRVQSVLQKDNVDQYKALHDERRRAEEATERAKEIIKSSRMMISKLVGQVADSWDESKEIQEAMAREKHKSTTKTRRLMKETLPKR